MGSAPPPAAELFQKLHDACLAEDSSLALQLSDKVLITSPGDPDAIHAKVTALTKLGQYGKAIQLLSGSAEYADELTLEHAYCLYRSNKLEECIAVIRQERPRSINGNAASRLSQLEAQVLYRMEDYKACSAAYETIRSSVDEDELAELFTNIIATRAGVALETGFIDEEVPDHQEATYEILYNRGCLNVAASNLEQAASFIQKAEDLCRRTLSSDGCTDDEIEAELRMMRIQLSYVYQHLGCNRKAKETYLTTLKASGVDPTLMVIAANNYISLQSPTQLPHNRARALISEGAKMNHKLSAAQRKMLAYNDAILLLRAKKTSAARRKATRLAETFKGDEIARQLLATIEGNGCDSRETLERLEWKEQPWSLPLCMSLIQAQVTSGNISRASEVMELFCERVEDSVRHKPGILALRLWLLHACQMMGKGATVLHAATLFYGTSGYSQQTSDFRKNLAALKLEHGDAAAAAKDYELLLQMEPTDTETAAGLTEAYAAVDLALAERYKSYLAVDVHSLIHGLAIDALEQPMQKPRYNADNAA
ncbi:hypothetical protein BC832DRAFT_222091 [Gaertneriomyces semiglobifer]|nr:hypothetical protein BC832DRAFT_222091 [Gaertneriomyces semiglobifer]